jgi:hypothetical protein
MKVEHLREGEVSQRLSCAERYRDTVMEVALAGKSGFPAWGISKQRFSPPRFTVSAQEVVHAATAQHTSRIELRIMCSLEHGEPFWKIPPRTIVATCVPRPRPPISLAASSVSNTKAVEAAL